MINDHSYELAFPRVLEAVAQGATKIETIEWLGRMYSNIEGDTLKALLADGLDDALACGIEREDIDPSWF